jgi:hypothetical protein
LHKQASDTLAARLETRATFDTLFALSLTKAAGNS